jgi:type I restriction enzyme R subunit
MLAQMTKAIQHLTWGIPADYFDFIIIDECHRVVPMTKELERILDYFPCSGLTATPKRQDNVDTYKYLESQFTSTLKEGINDGS